MNYSSQRVMVSGVEPRGKAYARTSTSLSVTQVPVHLRELETLLLVAAFAKLNVIVPNGEYLYH